jgi:NAD(P)-dependent dehydrogenase (short-subunit alcohol dehydrogenase family)
MSERSWRTLVTGAASGIGHGIAAHLAERGHAVWVSDLDGAAAESAAGDLRARGLAATALRLDVTSAADIDAAVALETADVDVTINTVCPSYVRTPLVDEQITGQAQAHGLPEQQVIEEIMLRPMPKRAFVTLEELGGIVEFLASDVARNVTGQWIAVDGGWTAQ